ncbi:MAG: hypothetical protein JKY60_08115 [Kordiimonadaceae bacterium]|nr:hypothetical protein [Kordiimonadaceae bacterium]
MNGRLYTEMMFAFYRSAKLLKWLFAGSLGLGVCFVFAAPVAALEPGSERHYSKANPVKIAMFEYPPTVVVKGGILSGLYVEQTRAILEESGLPYDIKLTPLGRMYRDFYSDAPKMDGWVSIPVSGALDIGAPVMPSAYSSITLSLYGKPGSVPPKLSVLNNSVLIVIHSYRYAGLLEKLQTTDGIQLITTPNHLVAFKLLMAGRAPYVLDYDGPAAFALRELGLESLPFTRVDSWVTQLFVSNKIPGSAKLLNRLSKAAERVLARRSSR